MSVTEDQTSELAPIAIAAVVAAAWTALPDYVASPSVRRAARGALVVMGGAAAGMAGARSPSSRPTGEDPTEPAPAAQASDDGTAAATSPLSEVMDRYVPNAGAARSLTTAAAIGGLVALIIGGLVVSQKVDDAVAGVFARRGVRRPYTAAGLLWSALTPLIWKLPDN